MSELKSEQPPKMTTAQEDYIRGIRDPHPQRAGEKKYECSLCGLLSEPCIHIPNLICKPIEPKDQKSAEASVNNSPSDLNINPVLKSDGTYDYLQSPEPAREEWRVSHMTFSGFWIGKGEDDFFFRITKPIKEAEQLARQIVEAVNMQGKWKCYHCHEVFCNDDAARLHFGPNEHTLPACKIDIKAVREMEHQLADYRNDDSDVLRQMSTLRCEQAQALQRAEESGYSKGLKDYSKLEATNQKLEAEVARLRKGITALKSRYSHLVSLESQQFSNAITELLTQPKQEDSI